MSSYNVLLFQQGGTLYLDEVLPGQPSLCTISITQLDGQELSALGGGFVDITDDTALIADLVMTLPPKQAPWRILVPDNTAGTIGDMVAEGRRFLLNRGGRKRWVRVSEFDVDGTDVAELRLDEGVDYAIKQGDTLSDVRCSYAVDWSSVTSDFVDRVKATWKVTVNGEVLTFVKIYDIVRQILYCPASWSDLFGLRPNIDNEISQVHDKELLIKQAWQDIITELRSSDIRHNLIIPDGSTVLRDAVVRQCLINLTRHHGLSAPKDFIGQADDYLDDLESELDGILGKFVMPVDENQDGKLTTREKYSNRRQHWFRRINSHRGRE